MNRKMLVLLLLGAAVSALQAQPPTPTEVAAQVLPVSPPVVLVSWSAPEGPWVFKIHRSEGDSAHFQWIGIAPWRYYNDPAVAGQTTYYYYVTSVDSQFRESPRSAIVSVSVGQTGQSKGAIAGTVTDDSTGDPVASVQVRLFRTDGKGNFVYSSITDSTGQYKVVVDTGSYLLFAHQLLGPVSPVKYKPEWYENAMGPASATAIPVGENETARIDVALERAAEAARAHVRGTVRDDKGNLLKGATVAVIRTLQEMIELWALTGLPPGIGPEAYTLPMLAYTRGVLWTGTTDSLGQYDAEVKDQAPYIAVASMDGYLPEYATEKAEPTAADILFLDGDTTGIDFTLTPVGTSTGGVSGTVEAPSGQALVGRVILFPRPNGSTSASVISTNTTEQGTFAIENVQSGTYYVQVVPYSDYAPAYYSEGGFGEDDWQSSDQIVVGDTTVTVTVGVVPLFTTGASTITGMVTETGGAPIAGVTVTASGSTGAAIGYGITDGSGRYSVPGVAPGTVTLTAGRIGYKTSEKSVVVPAEVTVVDNQDFTLVPSDPVSVGETGILPQKPWLDQNYPNPFNPSTTITFAVPTTSPVVLKVYDVLGREVAVLVNGLMEAGVHVVRFDSGSAAGGVYLYRLHISGFTQTRKMLLLR